MYLRSSSIRNKRSEDQLINELVDVFQRHHIQHGQPQDLAHLGADLVANDGFRNDLFSRCEVISHMSRGGLTPEQMLVLTAQALGGPGITNNDGAVDIPLAMRSAFLIGYEIWVKEGDEVDAPLDWPKDSNQAGQSSTTPFIASRSPRYSATDTQHSGSISPRTSLDNLTLNQLKTYIEDIEQRINRIEPQLGQINPRSASSSELVTQVNTSESHGAQPDNQIAASSSAAAALSTELKHPSGQDSLQNRSLVQRTVLPSIGPVLSSIGPIAPARSPAAPAPVPVPVQSLRAVIVALSFLLFLAVTFAAFFAYRYRHPDYPTPDVVQGPNLPGQQPTQQIASSSPAAAPPSAKASTTSQPSTPSTAKTTPSSSRDKISTMTAAPTSQAKTSPTAPSTPQPSTPAASQPSAPPANATPAPASPVAQTPPPAPVVAASPRPEPSKEESPAKVTLPASPPIPAASAPAPAPKPAVAAPAPTPRPAEPPPTAPAINTQVQAPRGPVNVSSVTLMRYAVATPSPAFPKSRFYRSDDIVVVQATISPNGTVTDARPISGPSDLRAAATKAMQAWRFRPYAVDGSPVEVVANFAFKPQ